MVLYIDIRHCFILFGARSCDLQPECYGAGAGMPGSSQDGAEASGGGGGGRRYLFVAASGLCYKDDAGR